MIFNADGNLLGRCTAFVLLVGVIVGVHRLSCGGALCPLPTKSCCASSAHGAKAK